MQALRLCRELQERGVDVKVITWGKLWHPKRGECNGVKFTRLRSIVNIVADLPALLKRQKAAAPVKIVYNDKQEVTTTMNSKVWSGMILRYKLVFYNLYIYLYTRRSQFDILHVHMMEWPAFTAVRVGKLLKKQVVIKDSTMNGIFNLLRYPDGVSKQQEVIEYANFVAMTQMIRNNFLKAGISPEKISMIPNGIPVTVPEPKQSWKNKVVFVGNLTQQPAKGIDVLLAAWTTVIESFPSATLTIVGEGDILAYTRHTESLSISGSVSFVGKQQNTKRILQESDVFVLPSRREGMSNALMEAMMCAMPVVVTDVSGSQDLVQNGVSGLIVPPAEIAGLAAAIIRMLSNPAEAITMGKKAYESITTKCDMRKVGNLYYDLYQKILSPHP